MCSIVVGNVFGPSVTSDCRDGFDFTLLFEETFFALAPCSIFPLGLPAQLYRLSSQRPRASTTGPILYVKLLSHLISTIVKITLLILVIPGLHVPKTRATIAAAALSAVASIAALSLSYWQHHRSPRPSTLLTLFLGSCIPLDAVRARTIWAVQILLCITASYIYTYSE